MWKVGGLYPHFGEKLFMENMRLLLGAGKGRNRRDYPSWKGLNGALPRVMVVVDQLH